MKISKKFRVTPHKNLGKCQKTGQKTGSYTCTEFSKFCITQKRKIDINYFQTLTFEFSMYLRARKKNKLLSPDFLKLQSNKVR